MVVVAPSIFAGDLADLRASLEVIRTSGAQWVHIDIMDGNFVPNFALSPEAIRSLLPYKGALKFEAHLMIQNPQKFLKTFASVGVDRITVHGEVSGDPQSLLTKIRQLGLSAGLAFNPETPFVPYDVDYYVVMGVHPGFAGQTFIPQTIEKIQAIRRQDSTTPIEVDGGMNLSTARMCIQAGANTIVAGSAFFGAPDARDFVQQLAHE